jgi:dipeptidyl aminopeptidase/acylaminoacyl peptidase
VTYEKDNATSESYLYDRESKTLSLLFLHHPKLKEYELGNTYPHTVKSRDDLDILVYLTLPPGLKVLIPQSSESILSLSLFIRWY